MSSGGLNGSVVEVPAALARQLARLHGRGLRVGWRSAGPLVARVGERGVECECAWVCSASFAGPDPMGVAVPGAFREATIGALRQLAERLGAMASWGSEPTAASASAARDVVGELLSLVPGLWPSAEDKAAEREERDRVGAARLAELGIDPTGYRLIAEEPAWLCLRERLVTPAMEIDENAPTFWAPKPDRVARRTPVTMPVRVAVLALMPGSSDRFLSMESPSHADEDEAPHDYMRAGECVEDAAVRIANELGVRVEFRRVLVERRVQRDTDPGEEVRVVVGAVARDVYTRNPRTERAQGMMRGAFGFVLREAAEAFPSCLSVSS